MSENASIDNGCIEYAPVKPLNHNICYTTCQQFLNPNATPFSPVIPYCTCNPSSDHKSSVLDSPLFSRNAENEMEDLDINDLDPNKILKSVRFLNVNRLIIGQLNINSLRNKFESLKALMMGNIDILVITETKLDYSFPANQFLIEGYALPFRIDHQTNAGGIIIYVREDIPCRVLNTPTNFQGIFLEINLRKVKWLLFGGYNPNKNGISSYLNELTPILDNYLSKYDNYLLLGDLNSEIKEIPMKEFCETYNLINLINEPTCFKNPFNPSSIDVILTNRSKRFQDSKAIETGLSDHHKMTITVLKTFFQKQSPLVIKYRDFRKFNQNVFRNELLRQLNNINFNDITYETFETTFLNLFNLHAPMKEKYVRANNAPFMNKNLSKAVMTRSRLRNIFLRNPTIENKASYNKYRNYCTKLFRKEKKLFYNNLDIKLITDNKTFWKTVKPFFSEKNNNRKKIVLLEGEEIISDDTDVAESMNNFFSNIVNNLNITGYSTEEFSCDLEKDFISNIILKFKNHPSILKIKDKNEIMDRFHFSMSNDAEMSANLKSLDKRKPSTVNNIPAKVIAENYDIISPFITKINNDCKSTSNFPAPLKCADITPAHKKEETTKKDNYRPVSILPSFSKIFERDMFDQISLYFNNVLSPFLCGFRKGYSTQHCLIVMIERWRKALDNSKLAGALLTDLSKAFDCLNHELLIAKLEAYGLDHDALTYIYSYLSDRKQRTKINNSLSQWSSIKSGVPQGSILGPLLFNVYINDIFYFINELNLTSYADDNTPYAIDSNIDNLVTSLEYDASILLKWFYNNYLVMNAKKSHLLITKHLDDVSIKVGNEIIKGKSHVKLLGITIDNKLDFTEHVSNLCKKVSTKLHALARISNHMSPDKLRLILKAFIESQFSYCPLIWMFHSRALNNRINRLHERALRLVYKDSLLTFNDLLLKDNSFTIHHRNLQKLAIEMYKLINNLSPPIMNYIFRDTTNPHNLRNKNPFQSTNVHSVFNGTETLLFRGPKTWALVPDFIKHSLTLTEFKSKIKKWKPIGCTCRLCKIYVKNLGFL